MARKRHTLTTDQYKQLLKDRVTDERSFIGATFSGRLRGHTVPWTKVTVRPVKVKHARKLQFSYFDATRDISKNYEEEEARERLDEVLALPFKTAYLAATTEDLHINIGRRGEVSVLAKQASDGRTPPEAAHDRRKQVILSPDSQAPFLHAVSITTQDGRVRGGMHGKLTQINQFLKLIEETGVLQDFPNSRVRVADLGCGNAYLTFAAYHYLTFIRGLHTDMVGVDVKGDLLAGHVEKARSLGWEGMSFEVTRIESYNPATPPDIVMALHACDTATDDALAKGVGWGSRLIFAAPCCHHNLQTQLDRGETPEPFVPVMHHGILKERLGDILTDAFRALILRILGYRTDVVEFVSGEHTPKNLMIRAVRTGNIGNPALIREYEELRGFWQVEPYLGKLLQREIEAAQDNLT